MSDTSKTIKIELDLAVDKAKGQSRGFTRDLQNQLKQAQQGDDRDQQRLQRLKEQEARRGNQAEERARGQARRKEMAALKSEMRERAREEQKASREAEQKRKEKSRIQAADARRSNAAEDRERRERQRKEQRALQTSMRERAREQQRSESTRYAAEKGRSEKWQRRRDRVGGFVKGAALLGGGFALGSLLSGASAAYGALSQVRGAYGGEVGVGNTRALRGERGTAQGLGFNMAESAQHGGMMARATGIESPHAVQRLMRARGVSAGEAASLYGTFDGAGAASTSQEHERKAYDLMVAATAAGMARGKHGEFFKGAAKLMQSQMSKMPQRVSSGDAGNLMALVGMEGKRQGLPGFAKRPGEFAAQITDGFRNPRGDAAKELALNMLGHGQGKSRWEAEKRLEKMGTPEVLDLLKGYKNVFGSEKSVRVALREGHGFSSHLSEALARMPTGGTKEEQIAAIEKAKATEQARMAEKGEKDLPSAGKNAVTKAAGDPYANVKRSAQVFDKLATQGTKVAKDVEKMQDWAFSISKAIFDLVKKIQTSLAPLIAAIQEAFSKDGAGGKNRNRNKAKSAAAEAAAVGGTGKKAVAAQVAEAKARMNAYSETMGEGDTVGDDVTVTNFTGAMAVAGERHILARQAAAQRAAAARAMARAHLMKTKDSWLPDVQDGGALRKMLETGSGADRNAALDSFAAGTGVFQAFLNQLERLGASIIRRIEKAPPVAKPGAKSQ